MTRKDKIAIAGHTGADFRWHGPALRIGIVTRNDIGELISLRAEQEKKQGGDYTWIDPLLFAAYDATDSNGNSTLPYWQGPQVDGHLDKLYAEHYGSRGLGEFLKRFPKREEVADLKPKIKELLSMPLLLTAPKANPEMPKLYR